MPNLQADQANFLLNGVYLPSLQNEHQITKKVIAAIPAGKEDYRPDQYARPALDLAWHIAATETVFLDAVANGQFDFSPRPKPDSIKNSADLVAWYEDNFKQRVAKVQALSTEQLQKIVDFRGMFQLPAVMYLGFILHHTVHHRGQLSVYLRPMGSKVPAMYGESYDSAEAKKAQAN
jgi:uncharacterized damage-inducible protein DinB